MQKNGRSPNPDPTLDEQIGSPKEQVISAVDNVRNNEDHEMSPEEQQECDRMAAAIIADDPHAVLVEFSSVVADTQEYIIGVSLLQICILQNLLKTSFLDLLIATYLNKPSFFNFSSVFM